jgi:hypothetical protein
VEGSNVMYLTLYHAWEDKDQGGGAILVGAYLERSLDKFSQRDSRIALEENGGGRLGHSNMGRTEASGDQCPV